MSPTNIMYPNEMIKRWLAGHTRIDNEASASSASSPSSAKTKYSPALPDRRIGIEDRSGSRPKSNFQGPTSEA